VPWAVPKSVHIACARGRWTIQARQGPSAMACSCERYAESPVNAHVTKEPEPPENNKKKKPLEVEDN